MNTANIGVTEKIRVFFKDIFNNDVQIDLRPGEIVYSQTNHLSNSLKIYSRKGVIEIKEEAKPNFLKYYVGYKQEEIEDKYFLYNLQNSLKKDESEKPTTAQAETEVSTTTTENVGKLEEKETIVDKAIKEVKKYSEKKKKTTKPKSRRGPGRPKKRGPKKGSKRKKMEE